jgi:hypothetical protein
MNGWVTNFIGKSFSKTRISRYAGMILILAVALAQLGRPTQLYIGLQTRVTNDGSQTGTLVPQAVVS